MGRLLLFLLLSYFSTHLVTARLTWPAGQTVYGETYATLGAWWWRQVASIPLDKNPLFDTTGAFCNVAQAGPIWWLHGSWLPNNITFRTCTVPCDKTLFLPVYNVVSNNLPYFNGTDIVFWDQLPDYPESMKEDAKSVIDEADTDFLVLELDGNPIPELHRYRSGLSSYFYQRLPYDNLYLYYDYYQILAGDYLSIADGYVVALKPLSEGWHTVKFGYLGFYEVTYHLLVNSC